MIVLVYWLGDRKGIRPVKKRKKNWMMVFVGGDDLTGVLHGVLRSCVCFLIIVIRFQCVCFRVFTDTLTHYGQNL